MELSNHIEDLFRQNSIEAIYEIAMKTPEFPIHEITKTWAYMIDSLLISRNIVVKDYKNELGLREMFPGCDICLYCDFIKA